MPGSLFHSQCQMLEKPTAGEHPVVVPVIRSMRDTTVCGSRKIAARHTDAKLGRCPRTRPAELFKALDEWFAAAKQHEGS
jgi:hypothetical protein